MAKKPFYSMEEVCAKLGRTPDDIKAMVREGELREFRDAGKVFFKVEDIDRMVGTSGASKEDTGEILLEPASEVDLDESAGSGAHPPLNEASSGGTSIIGLEPLPEEEEEAPAPAPKNPQQKKKEDTVITKSGIGVFDDDELEIDADPMAKTQITTGATGDQITLESAGSGSGLLDLAREADDTALGADLMDEIWPGEGDAAPATPAAKPAAKSGGARREAEPMVEEATALPVDTGEVVSPVLVTVGDTQEGIFSGVLVATILTLGLALTISAGALQDAVPDMATKFANGSKIFIYMASMAVLAGVCIGAGWFINKAAGGPRRR